MLTQLLYQSSLISLCFFTKLILSGYQPFDDEFDLNKRLLPLLQLSQVSNVSSINERLVGRDNSPNLEYGKDFTIGDSQFALQLDRLFACSWYGFLGVLVVYCSLLVIRLVQYALPTLRTRAILAFILNDAVAFAFNKESYNILGGLNSKIHIFHLLYQIGSYANASDISKTILEDFQLQTVEVKECPIEVRRTTKDPISVNDSIRTSVNSETSKLRIDENVEKSLSDLI